MAEVISHAVYFMLILIVPALILALNDKYEDKNNNEKKKTV
ncbi:MAG: hypothetical protein ACOCUI_00345 [bacterium]